MNKEKEPYHRQGDEAEDEDEGDVAPGVAGFASAQESVATGAVVGELPEAGEATHLIFII